MKFLSAIFSAIMAALTPVTAAAEDMSVVEDLDVGRYLGTWHEIARMPMIFQARCKNSQAEYQKIDDATISVHNTCTRFGLTRSILGDAIVEAPGKLAVSFSKWAPKRSNYWVLYVTPEYSYAVVGEPRRKYGWILSRTPTLPAEDRDKAEQVLKDNGYNTSKLIWNDPR